MKHTKGTLFVLGNGYCLAGASSGMGDAHPDAPTARVAMCFNAMRSSEENAANAERLAACWNALVCVADPVAFVARAKAIEGALKAYEHALPTEDDAKNEAAMNEGRCSESTARGLALRAALALPGGAL